MNYKRDNKTNRQGDMYKPKGYDLCQTPPYALGPLLGHLKYFPIVWESACGEGYLVRGLHAAGLRSSEVVATDIQTGHNFFEWTPGRWDIMVTNPPYSVKYKWLARCYALGKPFALLMPVETLGAQKGQTLFERYGLELILLNRRVDFKMPNKGWDGAGAQFPVAWFTWGLQIGRELTYADVSLGDKAEWEETCKNQGL